MPKRSLLIIDDDFSQVILVEQLIKHHLGLPHDCYHALNGTLAMEFLHRRTPYENARRPDLILLDLELPGKHGCEVLREIKTDPARRAIPVIILSDSRNDADIAACYQHHANAYIRKAGDLEGALRVVASIDRFWLTTAELLRPR